MEHSVKPPESPSRFPWIVSGLLVVIVVSLSGLWVMERGHRLRASMALRNQQADAQKKIQAMGNMLAQQMGQASSVDRTQLATQQVNWNGQPRTVLLLSAAAGQGLGFQPGDAILVTPSAETQPR